MTDPTTPPGQIRHGTLQGYRNDGCRQECCRAAKRDHERELQAPKRAARWARIAADHAATGERPPKCRCATCAAARDTPTRATTTVSNSSAAAHSRARRRKERLEATRPVGGWEFIRHALHQADPDPREAISPKAVVCCETEAIEPEGAGHDWWCPALTTLDRKVAA